MPIGSTDLTIELFVGLADVSVRISPPRDVLRNSPPLDVDEWERLSELCEHIWELSQFPLDQSTLHGELRKSLVACGCDDVLAERLAERTLQELAALVATARSERERRLSLLSAKARIEWGELTPIHRDGEVDGMWTQGMPIADGGSIMVRLTYRVGIFKIGGGHSVTASIVSTRPGRAEQGILDIPVPLDGICCDALCEWLEMFGWSSEVGRSVGRAVAVKARADWMAGALPSARSAARRMLFAEIAKSRSEAQ